MSGAGNFVYAWRMLRKTPLVTSIAVLALALGIGANTAIFSMVQAVLLAPLPYPHPDRLVQVCRENQGGGQIWVSVPNFLDWRQQNTVMADMAGYAPGNFNFTGNGTAPVRVGGYRVDTNFLAALGIRPALGRDFSARDDEPGRPPVALISYALWQARFGGEAGIIGRTVQINGQPVPVLGVLPPGFRFPGNPQVLEPLQPAMSAARGANAIHALARLKPGISLAAAQAQMHAIGSRLAQQYPEANQGNTVGLVPLQKQWTGSTGPMLWMLLGAVGLVLLIACADLANLLLARALGRQREVAIRMALGADRGRILRQLLAESMVLALAGGIVGLGIAYAGIQALRAWAPVNAAASLNQVLPLSAVLDWPVLLFTLALAVVAGLLFGLAPAWHTAQESPGAALQSSAGRAGTGAGRSGRRLRSLLIVAEIALTVPLLTGAGLLLSSLAQQRATDGGFNADHVLTAHLALAPARYGTSAAVDQFARRLLPRLRALPGVRAAALTLVLPLTTSPDLPMQIGGHPPELKNTPDAEWHPSSAETFAALGTPILSGRGLEASDTARSQLVVVINQAAAARWWPHKNPVGQTLWVGQYLMPAALRDPGPRTIVGVVGNVRQNGLNLPADPAIYVPLAQMGDGSTQIITKLLPMSLMVRTAGSPDALRAEVQQTIWSVDPEQPISDLLTMRQVEAAALGPQSFNLALLGIFAFLALGLAAMGIYGVMSYAVAERRREIGLRMALGATPRQLLGMVLGEGMKLALAGIVIGGLAAWALQRLLAHQVTGLAGFPPGLVLVAAAGIFALALAATLAPAVRAAQLDPLTALRQD